MIAEVDLDLAAFAYQEIYEYRLRMLDTIEAPAMDTVETYNSDNSLEDLLDLMNDDSFEMEKKAQARITSR